jgi:hypothetical protein
MHPPTSTGLYWSLRGEVACADHAPPTEDPRWTTEGWNALPVSSGHIKGTHYQCQYCSTDGRSVVHTPPTR